MKLQKDHALELVKTCCRVLDDKKAGELKILDVSEQSSITDYLILATATSEPHLRALRVEVEKALDSAEIHVVGKETVQESGWVVLDAFDVMVHLFLSETRERYGLERLWRDASELNVAKLIQTPAPVAGPKKRAPVKSKSPRKKKAKSKA
jgi:ribosome-associated protein